MDRRTVKRTEDKHLDGVRRTAERLVLAVAVAAALAAVGVPRLAGATPYAVLTGSMSPAMPPGTLVVVRDVDPAQIGVGDVITFMPYPHDLSVVTHRVIGVGFDGDGRTVFQTRGDANPAADPWLVGPQQLVGRRWYFVPYLGYVTHLLDDAQRQAGTIAVAGGLLLYALLMFSGALRDRMRRPRSGALRV